ncbi:MAG: efflux RND transporter permease subunit [Gemmatimonadota bacterium]
MSADHHKERHFGPTNLAIANRITVGGLVFIIATLGLLSYRTVPKEASPEITIPMVSVSTVYPGVSPKDMETLVTRVIEDELNKIADITQLTSASDQGYSNVTAEFDIQMDMDEALQKVRDKLDLAKPKLPADAEEPVLTEFNLSEFPIMQVNISGAYGLVRLKEVAEDIQDELEQIPALLEARLSGGLEREVRVDVDLERLQFHGVAFTDVIDAIRAENVNVPGGSIDVGTQEFLVRVAGEFQDTREIEDVVVATFNGRNVKVRDVARVDFGFKDEASYARLDGSPVVTLDIVMRSGENIIETADEVKAVVAGMQPTLPPSTVVKFTSDQSKDIRAMVASLENNIISGLLLVVAVLLFFLGVRNASFVGISIPLSMLLSFIVLKMVGISMNMIVLFSLILALGMLVDNAVVVVENIYRHLEQGYDNFTAARLGTGEVALPIISSTLTTLAAFLPLVFWPDIMGEFMGYLPKTLIITLSSSLFVALVVVPPLCAMFMRLDHGPRRELRRPMRWLLAGVAAAFLLIVASNNVLAAALMALIAVGVYFLHTLVLSRMARWFQAEGLPRLVEDYKRRLRWSLAHRAVILGGAVAVFVGSFILFGALNAGVELFPEDIPPATVYARVDVPSGTVTEFTNEVAARLEDRLAGIEGMVDAKSVVTTVGAGGRGGLFGSNAEGSVAINFVDYQDRQTDVFATLAAMQGRLGQGIAGANVTVEKPSNGPSSGKPVTIELIGPEVERLKELSDSALLLIKAASVYSRLEGLESDMQRGRAEVVVRVDREAAALYDLNTSQIGSTVRTAIQGSEAAKYRSGNDEYDITVRLDMMYRNSVEALADLTIMADGGRQIPLNSVASWHVDEGLGTVKRKDMDRVATVTSNVRAGEQSAAVLGQVQEVLAPFAASLPAGYSLRYGGQQVDMAESMAFLSSAFMIALLLIALILMSQFNSVLQPLIVMTSVIMSTVGVLLGLLLFRMPFGIIMTGVGVISLAGIVVNNAIVLIDYIDLLRERDGLSRDEALVEGGATRFRPVILTAVTTILGLVPLAIGFNFDFFGFFSSLDPDLYWGGEQAAWWGPMAIAVIAGLAFATVLTLVVVPVLYAVLDDLASWFRRTFTRAGEPAGPPLLEIELPPPPPAHDGRPRAGARELEEALARFQQGPSTA